MVRLRVRIRFSKQGDLRLIGHRDLMRCLERLFRRAGLALSFSEGFHPKPRMTFPLALAVGIEGLDEVMELELAEPADRRRNCCGVCRLMPRRDWCSARWKCCPRAAARPASKAPPTKPRFLRPAEPASVGGSSDCWPPRPGRSSAPRAPAIDLRPLVSELALGEEVLAMRLRVDSRGSVGPREVLAALGLSEIEREGVHLRRIAVEVCP